MIRSRQRNGPRRYFDNQSTARTGETAPVKAMRRIAPMSASAKRKSRAPKSSRKTAMASRWRGFGWGGAGGGGEPRRTSEHPQHTAFRPGLKKAPPPSPRRHLRSLGRRSQRASQPAARIWPTWASCTGEDRGGERDGRGEGGKTRKRKPGGGVRADEFRRGLCASAPPLGEGEAGGMSGVAGGSASGAAQIRSPNAERSQDAGGGGGGCVGGRMSWRQSVREQTK